MVIRYVENYVGPVEVRYAGNKGRGLFVTRDVQVGELLFAEKAFAFKEETDTDTCIGADYYTKKVYKTSTAQINWDITMLINDDPAANARLALLAYDNKKPNDIIPSMDNFRSNTFHEVPVLSAKRVYEVTDINAFSFSFDKEKTAKERKRLNNLLRPGVEAFGSNIMSTSSSSSGHRKRKDGTALWILGSFMNHSTIPSTWRRFFGQMMFVYASFPLTAGDEVSTTYSDDPETLKQWGILS